MNYKQTQRYKKRGWFGESHRHYLAAKGISTTYDHSRFKYFNDKQAKRIGELTRDDFASEEAYVDFLKHQKFTPRPRKMSDDLSEIFAVRKTAITNLEEEFAKKGIKLDPNNPEHDALMQKVKDDAERAYKDVRAQEDRYKSMIQDIDDQMKLSTARIIKKNEDDDGKLIIDDSGDAVIADLRSAIAKLNKEGSGSSEMAKKLRNQLDELLEQKEIATELRGELGLLRDARRELISTKDRTFKAPMYTYSQLTKKALGKDKLNKMLAEIPPSVLSMEDRKIMGEPEITYDPVQNKTRLETPGEINERMLQSLIEISERSDMKQQLRNKFIGILELDPSAYSKLQLGIGRSKTPIIHPESQEQIKRLSDLQVAFAKDQQKDAPAMQQFSPVFGETDTTVGRVARRLPNVVAPKDSIKQSTRRVDKKAQKELEDDVQEEFRRVKEDSRRQMSRDIETDIMGFEVYDKLDQVSKPELAKEILRDLRDREFAAERAKRKTAFQQLDADKEQGN